MTLLSVHGLDAGYGSLRVVHAVDLDVAAGEVAVIAGPNGAGKSTLLGAIAGAISSSAGKVAVDGRDVTKLGCERRLKQGLGWVPEGRNLFLHLTVRDNLVLSARLAGTYRRFPALLAQCCELFPVLKTKLDDKAGTLSGGEQQIVALARVLVREPRVAMLDEPTVGLAPRIVERLGGAVAATKQQGIAWVVAEQNLVWLADIATSVHILDRGRLRHLPDVGMIRSRDRIRAAFFEAVH